jgi:hypothetical protein
MTRAIHIPDGKARSSVPASPEPVPEAVTAASTTPGLGGDYEMRDGVRHLVRRAGLPPEALTPTPQAQP